jgi:hypothetical protein
MRQLAIVILLCARVAAAESAPPMKPEARAHLVRGLEHYEKGRFAEAVSEFLAGQAIDAQPEFRYALGQAERKRGRCAEAIVYYQSYLDTRPSSVQAATARQNIARCKATVAELPPPSTPAPAPTLAPAPSTTPPPAPRANAAHDWRGHLLWSLGALTVAAGGTLWGLAERDLQAVAGATRYDQFTAAYDSAAGADSQRIAGIVVLSAGGALIVAGIARLGYVARR